MRKLVIAALTLGMLSVTAQFAEARYLEYPVLFIQVEIQADGSAKVFEERRINFHGKYEGFYQYIYTDRGIDIKNVRVREGNQYYEFNPTQTEGPPGTYFVKQGKDHIFIDWSVEAANESRTFVLEYEIENLVRVYDDYATFYHQFVGDEWAEAVESLIIVIYFPQELSQDQVGVWAYGPTHGRSRVNEDGSITLTVERLPAYTFVESRVVFPREVVSASGNTVAGDIAPTISKEEAEWAKGLASAQRRKAYSRILFPIFFSIPLVILLRIYLKNNQEKRSFFLKNGEYYRELPQEISPVLVMALLKKNNIKGGMNKGISASLLKLAVDGLIYIEEIRPGSSKRKIYNFRLLNPDGFAKVDRYEKLILSMFFEVISPDGNNVSTKDIQDFNKSWGSLFRKPTAAIFEDEAYIVKFNRAQLEALAGQGKIAAKIAEMAKVDIGAISLSLTALVRTLATLAEKELREKYQYLTSPVLNLRNLLLAAGVFIAIWAGFIYIYLATDATSLFVVPGFVFPVWATIAFLAEGYNQRTARGKEEYYKWVAFQNFLKDFSALSEKEIPHIAIWDKYLVYATVLGVAKTVIRHLKRIYPEAADTSNRSWCSVSAGANIFGSSSFAGSMSGALPSSGSGGGMSGGGGGGSGGGGGGGR